MDPLASFSALTSPAGTLPAWAMDVGMLLASLAAIIVTSWAVRQLGLGVSPQLRNIHDAIAEAEASQIGFQGTDAVLDRFGAAALVRNALGDEMLIRRNENFFVGRLITPDVMVRLDRDQIQIRSDDPSFGDTVLDLHPGAGSQWILGMKRRADALDRNRARRHRHAPPLMDPMA